MSKLSKEEMQPQEEAEVWAPTRHIWALSLSAQMWKKKITELLAPALGAAAPATEKITAPLPG